MAEKDWRKNTLTGNVPAWTNKIDQEEIWIVRAGGKGTGWDFRSDVTGKRNFKTFSEALRFAKAYRINN